MRTNATSPEQALWQMLRGKQMGVKFRRQHGIGHYIVDFYCSEQKLVIEVDGDSHFTDDAQEYDQIRDAYLQGLELTVLRFTNEQVMQNLVGVCEIIGQVIEGKHSLPTCGKNPLPTSPLAGGGARNTPLVPSPAKGRVRVGFSSDTQSATADSSLDERNLTSTKLSPLLRELPPSMQNSQQCRENYLYWDAQLGGNHE